MFSRNIISTDESVKKEISVERFTRLKNMRVANVSPMSKEEYLKIVQDQRAEFVHKHFGKEITEIFNKLREEADKMKHCHSELKIEVPDYFDVNKTEETLRSYFRGLGYEVIAEPRKNNTNTIVITLT